MRRDCRSDEICTSSTSHTLAEGMEVEHMGAVQTAVGQEGRHTAVRVLVAGLLGATSSGETKSEIRYVRLSPGGLELFRRTRRS